jgi:hypothetical protein
VPARIREEESIMPLNKVQLDVLRSVAANPRLVVYRNETIQPYVADLLKLGMLRELPPDLANVPHSLLEITPGGNQALVEAHTEQEEFERAVAEIAKRAPLMLDATAEYPVDDGKGGKERKQLGWSDEHRFSVPLPAWVLRAVRKHVMK